MIESSLPWGANTRRMCNSTDHCDPRPAPCREWEPTGRYAAAMEKDTYELAKLSHYHDFFLSKGDADAADVI